MANQDRTSGSQGREPQSAPTSSAQSGAHYNAPPAGSTQAGGTQPGGAQAGGAQAGGVPGTGGRLDQERPMELSREGHPAGVQPGESSGRQQGFQQGAQPGGQAGLQQGAQHGVQQGTQQGGQYGMQRGGGSVSQPSLLPAFFANPGLMASAFMANPFEFAEAMTREMDRIFENFGPSTAALAGPGAGRHLGAGAARSGALAPTGQGQQRAMRSGGTFTPPMELLQRGNELVVRADLPGLRPEDVQVEVDQGMLVISGERRNEFEDQRSGFYRSERHYGAFHRAIPLPEGVSEDEIRATFNHGVLEVAVPVRQQPEQRARRIQVQSAGASGAVSGQSAGQSAGHVASQSASPGATGSGGSTSSTGAHDPGAPPQGSSAPGGGDARRHG